MSIREIVEALSCILQLQCMYMMYAVQWLSLISRWSLFSGGLVQNFVFSIDTEMVHAVEACFQERSHFLQAARHLIGPGSTVLWSPQCKTTRMHALVLVALQDAETTYPSSCLYAVRSPSRPWRSNSSLLGSFVVTHPGSTSGVTLK